MKEFLKRIVRWIKKSPFAPVFKVLYSWFTVSLYWFLTLKWKSQGKGKPAKDQMDFVAENVTFIYKSFQRQKMAKRLYRNIQRYYPKARVIIADDSKKPLKIKGEYATVVQLPFNVGICKGLNEALSRVETPFTMRLDDDVLLTPFTRIHHQLDFLIKHPEIHIAAVQACNAPFAPNPRRIADEYINFSMDNAPKKLLIPHLTQIEGTHFVLGKVSNIFLARTEEYKSLGYDNNIRMIDHHEFFYRAAGVLVASTDIDAFVFHYHNPFDKKYMAFRSDYLGDKAYIRKKHNL